MKGSLWHVKQRVFVIQYPSGMQNFPRERLIFSSTFSYDGLFHAIWQRANNLRVARRVGTRRSVRNSVSLDLLRWLRLTCSTTTTTTAVGRVDISTVCLLVPLTLQPRCGYACCTVTVATMVGSIVNGQSVNNKDMSRAILQDNMTKMLDQVRRHGQWIFFFAIGLWISTNGWILSGTNGSHLRKDDAGFVAYVYGRGWCLPSLTSTTIKVKEKSQEQQNCFHLLYMYNTVYIGYNDNKKEKMLGKLEST